MSKETTIIELLNKIANGEEIPEKIKYNGKLYVYDNGSDDYLECGDEDMDLFGYAFSTWRIGYFINDKVEIIEGNKDIKELKIKNGKVVGEWENGSSYAYTLSAPQTVMVYKINELVREIKKLKKGNND